MNTNDAVAKRILKLAREKKMTMYKVEQKSGVYHGAMDRIMKSKNKTVTLDTVFKLSNAFNMTVIEFLDDEVFDAENIDFE